MSDITGTFNTNTDGSIDLPTNDDKSIVRWVKESDLLAVKGGAETKATEWEGEKAKFNTDLAESNRLREESHQSLLQAQASNEQLKETYKDHDTLKTKVGELETELGTHKESVGKFETELAGRIRHNLTNNNGAKEDDLKDKTLDQLRNLEEAARILVGVKVKPANYDGGPGGSHPGGGPESPTDRANRILADHDAKKGKVS